jgi:hypothetical protein
MTKQVLGALVLVVGGLAVMVVAGLIWAAKTWPRAEPAVLQSESETRP